MIIGQYLLMTLTILFVLMVFIARLSRNKPIAKRNKVLIYYYKLEKYLGVIFLIFFLTGIIFGIYQFYKLDNNHVTVNAQK